MDMSDQLARGFAKALGPVPDEAVRHYVSTGHGSLPGTASLLAWDANSIHAFVFDTTNATGVRGASDILKTIDDELREGKAPGLTREQVLFAGGGSGLAVVSKEETPNVVRGLHALFAEETLLATCSAASVDLVCGAEGFADRVRAVGRALARNRILTGPDPEPAVPFFLERCDVCGRRAASGRRQRKAGERLECEPCSTRIDRGRTKVRYQHEPADYQAIAGGDDGRGSIAVVYLDGNGIGKRITSLSSPWDYAQFSAAIAGVMRDSFREEARRYELLDEDDEREGRYQLPICGGDDLVAIVPGEISVPFARDLLLRFETNCEADGALRDPDNPLSAAAGVAIAHVKFPIRYLIDEAKALLGRAKGRFYRAKRVYGHRAPSALDFAVIADGSPRSETVEPERWARLPEEMLYSGRPYTLKEMTTFSDRFGKILAAQPAVGRSQLYALHRYAQAGPAQLRNHILYQIGRREEWRQLVAKLAADDRVIDDKARCMATMVPRYGDREVFDVADMIELLDHWQEPARAQDP